MKNQVVVRFAPSPTGYLHIGGARTAIFNWLYARQTGGKFILRIEDTDAERSTEDSIQGIVDGLNWLGLDWDEGPNFQSRNMADHLAAAERLLVGGHAYRCFCTQEEIETQREAARQSKTTYQYDGRCRNLSPEAVAEKEAQGIPHVIRLKIPEGEGGVVFEDAVYGRIEKKYADLEDFIIVRSNGRPLYVLSNAVDDIRDRVTHIIRGQDGLANTPKQILLYEALGAPLPVFAHMSLTLDPQKAKISKRRHGEMVAVHYYREKGFLPWALFNFLVLLGWATTDSREIFSKEELIQAFALEGISRTNSVFNIQKDNPKYFTDPKALSINAHYIGTMPLEELFEYVRAMLEKESLWDTAYDADKKDWCLETIDLLRERFHVLTDFADAGRAFFSDEFSMDETSVQKHLTKNPGLKDLFPKLAQQILAMPEYGPAEIETLLRAFIKENGVKAGVLINGIRVAVTGQAKGPDFIKSLALLGKQRVAGRLERSLRRF